MQLEATGNVSGAVALVPTDTVELASGVRVGLAMAGWGEHDLLEGLAHFKTDGLIILHDNKMLYEEYWNDNDKNSKHISWSVAKSFLSALMGIALDEGLIDSIDDPVTKYLPEFKGTGYEGVKIKNILQMSSGVAFNEDYADPNSDINKFGRATILKEYHHQQVDY